ncbi:hypothetical protein Peur_043148 [Populus x canadensis]
MVHKIKKEIHRFGLAPNYVAAPFRHGLIGNVQSVFKREICSPNVPFLDYTSFMKDNIQKKNPRCEFFPSPQGNRILFAWGPKPH